MRDATHSLLPRQWYLYVLVALFKITVNLIVFIYIKINSDICRLEIIQNKFN